MLPIPQEIEVANGRMTKKIQKIGLSLLVLGLVMPAQWKEMLGLLSMPISWLASAVPSVRKSVEISPISDLIQGYFGTVLLLLPVFFLFLIWRDPIATRFKYSFDKAPSKFSYFLMVYFVIVPFFAFLLYVLFVLPIDVHLGVTPTRGQLLFSLLVSYRVAMAILGSFVLLGACLIAWLMTILLAGPFLYFFKRLVHHGK